jgi:Tol biopolymer transport system component
MEAGMERVILLVGIFALAILLTCCNSPSQPETDIGKEANLIPWSKITGRIAFSRTGIEGSLVGYLYIADGNSRKLTLVKKSEGVQFANLAWSTDGREITYSNFDIGKYRWQLYNVDVEGGQQSVLFSVDAHNNYPAWSSDGRLAYWYNGADPPGQLMRGFYAIWIDGQPFFSKAYCDQSRPAWSHDSRSLVISMRDSTSQGALYAERLVDESMTALRQGIGFDPQTGSREIFGCPIYSPDGSKIAFTRWGGALKDASGDHSEIWIMNADGTGAKRLTSGSYDWYPAWSPEGTKIAFERGGKILIMNSDGSELTQVTEGMYPVWTP